MVVVGWLVLWVIGGIRSIESRDRLRFLVVAVVGYCGYIFGFSVGVSLTSAFSASLLLALVPLWIIVFNSMTRRRLPNVLTLVAFAIASAGVVMFVSARTSVALGLGDLVSLTVAGLYAGYLLLNRPLIDRYPPITLITYTATLAAIPIMAVTAYTFKGQDLSDVSLSGWMAMAWAIVVPYFSLGPHGVGCNGISTPTGLLRYFSSCR